MSLVTGWLWSGVWLNIIDPISTSWSTLIEYNATTWTAITASVASFQRITFSATPVAGSFVINFNGYSTTAIAWDATAGDVQTAINLIAGLELAAVNGAINQGSGLGIAIYGYLGAPEAFTCSLNTLAVTITVTIATAPSGPNSTVWTLLT